jgi:hypothetical protein
VEALVAKAIAAARAALNLTPTERETPAHLHAPAAPRPCEWKRAKQLGLAYWQWARYRQDRNLDPRDPLRQALETFEAILIEHRNHEVHHNLGLIYKVWAD